MRKPSESKMREIAHEVVSKHIRYPAPKGHKGLEKLMKRKRKPSKGWA